MEEKTETEAEKPEVKEGMCVLLLLQSKIKPWFLVAPSLRAERLIWSLCRVSVCPVVCMSVSHSSAGFNGSPVVRDYLKSLLTS